MLKGRLLHRNGFYMWSFYLKSALDFKLLATTENYERLCDLGAHGCERKESARTYLLRYLHTMVRTSEGTMFQSSKLELL